jgi:hypothetical protein
MTDKRKQDESSTGHHADAHGSTPLNDDEMEQVSGGMTGCTRSSSCTASSHASSCPKSPNYTAYVP